MAAFTLNQADLAFVLHQIKVAEVHASGVPLTEIRLNPDGTVISDRSQYDAVTGLYLGNPATPRAIPDPHVPVGLRTVDGTYNNIVAGRELWGPPIRPCRVRLIRISATMPMATRCRLEAPPW